jgi:hypothetical protein
MDTGHRQIILVRKRQAAVQGGRDLRLREAEHRGLEGGGRGPSSRLNRAAVLKNFRIFMSFSHCRKHWTNYILGDNMSLLMYANIGFRCESVYREFQNHLDKNTEINNIILKDSKKILQDCLRIENDDQHAIYLRNLGESDVESILYDYILEKKDRDIINKLRRISGNIENIKSLRHPQMEELCLFFKDIVEICKDKVQPNFASNEFPVPGM